jgi:hemerythrin-like domain-containing protein
MERPQSSGTPATHSSGWLACQHANTVDPDSLRASLPSQHPIATLLDEHQALLLHLNRMAELAARPRLEENHARRNARLEEIESIAAQLIAAEPHHQREELVLFPALQERGIHGPPGLMAAEHVELRELEHDFLEATRRVRRDSGSWLEVRDLAAELEAVLRMHIAKENCDLFPLALRAIPESSVWNELKRRCDEIGYYGPQPASIIPSRG